MDESIHFLCWSKRISIISSFKMLLLFLILTQVNSDHGQWDCQANEIFIECGSCEASCKIPLIKDCSKECRPQRCECQSKNGFVRAHDGACIHFNECETYSIMSKLHPGQHVTITDNVQSTTSKSVKNYKKTTKPNGVHFDEPQTEVPPTLDSQETEEENEREIVDNNDDESKLPSSESKEDGLPPAIAPNEYGREATSKKPIFENKKPTQAPFTLNKNHHVLDRDSSLVNYNQNPKANFLGSDHLPSFHLPSFRSTTLIGNDRSEDEGGYGLQEPSQIYGARPILPGEVSDKYVPKMPSVGAPAKNPQPPGNPPYKYAYAPSSPVLMHDDSAYALYPPQKYRIYRRKREQLLQPIGPPKS